MTIRPTERPQSRPDLENGEDNDRDVLLGQIMASQVRIERGWNALKSEHETFARTSTAVYRDVNDLRAQMNELLESERATSKRITVATRAAPVVLAAVELIRAALAAYAG